MKRKNTRALLSLALALLMTLSLLPTAFAEEAPPSPTLSSPSPSPAASPLPSPVASPGAERSPDPSPGPEKTYVAKIVRDGTDVSFETIDAAIADAAAGETIILLADCAAAWTEGYAFRKNLSFSGSFALSFPYGFCVANGVSLQFSGCAVSLPNVPSGHNGDAPGGKYGIVVNPGASLNVSGGSLSIIGCAGDGIYGHAGAVINFAGAAVTISGSVGNGIAKDNGAAYLNITGGSSVTISGSGNGGVTNTYEVTVDASSLTVSGCRGNGSNGSNFYVKNGSTVVFDANGAHGLSADKLYISGSKVEALNNKYNGIVARDTAVDAASHVLVSGNAASVVKGAFRVLGSSGKAVIDAGADVQIINNFASGIHVEGSLVMNSGLVSGNMSSAYGGGIFNPGTAEIGSAVVLCNNHAATAGDDVYSTGAVTLGPVAQGQSLDGTEGTGDCLKPIDAWYEDGETVRWNPHSLEGLHAEAVPAGAFSAPVALKAAHGIPALDEIVPADAKLFKLDSVTGKPVPGVKFTLYADQGCTQVIGNYISDETGLVTLPGLLLERIYYMKETKAAGGYHPLSAIFTVKLLENPEKLTENVLEDGEVVSKTYRTALDFEISSDLPCLTETDGGKIAVLNEAFVNANISKVWVDNGETKGRTESVEISLRANGKEIEKIILSGANGWAVTRELPRYDDKGKEIKYSLVELTKVDGYVTGYSTEGFTVYNTLASLAPKTGDDTNIWLWVSLMALCAAAAAGAGIYIKKRGKKEP